MPTDEKVLHEATLCFPVTDGCVTLARKMSGIGKGKMNGYGGGREKGESVRACAVRELFEESGGVIARPEHLKKVAIAHFHNRTAEGKEFTCTVHIFTLSKWVGSFLETAEMGRPTLFFLDDLPLKQMMPADQEWVPLVLQARKKVVIDAWYGVDQKKLLRGVQIVEVSEVME